MMQQQRMFQFAFDGQQSMASKSQSNMSLIKQKFSAITTQLDQQHKSNLQAYRTKYLQLAQSVHSLYLTIKKCHTTITNHQKPQPQPPPPPLTSTTNIKGKEGSDRKMELREDMAGEVEDGVGGMYGVAVGEDCVDPGLLVEFCRQFCWATVDCFLEYCSKEKQIKQQMNQLFCLQTNSHFLQALSKKNLQNYNLTLQTKSLQKIIEYKQMQSKLAQKTTQQYQKKFKQCQKDFNNIVVSIANILKQCQISESQLRQENRLQKEFIQSQKIQFQRYKMDFKMRPTEEEKVGRIRRVLQKQFRDREAIIIKQSQKIAQQKLKSKQPKS